jgi:hypothetical protein
VTTRGLTETGKSERTSTTARQLTGVDTIVRWRVTIFGIVAAAAVQISLVQAAAAQWFSEPEPELGFAFSYDSMANPPSTISHQRVRTQSFSSAAGITGPNRLPKVSSDGSSPMLGADFPNGKQGNLYLKLALLSLRIVCQRYPLQTTDQTSNGLSTVSRLYG